MTLIKSISGIRGTIGGFAGQNLTPQDIVECTAAFGYWILKNGGESKVVLGRDGRISGEIVNGLVVNTLRALGIDVLDLGLSTTPTVEVAVPLENAGAGIILTASHNPKQWNALKFLNGKGEFISKEDGETLLQIIEDGSIEYADVDNLGSYEENNEYIQKHIDLIFDLPLVKRKAVQAKKFKVVIDPVNSTGAISLPPLLEQMGCELIMLNGELTGDFAHNPEPLPAHLKELSETVVREKADLGISVDPDVDRLAFVCEDGTFFGEEYTLVTVADYILKHTPGNTVSNLSSTRALRDVTEKARQKYFGAAVGEVNVVNKMKEEGAVIGGEGNGGIIYPELHYGRDALVGVAMFLSYLTEMGGTVSALRKTYPFYHISKNKIQLTPAIDVDLILSELGKKYANEECDTVDGLKVIFQSGDWVHLRKSNTEPIIRVYSESKSEETAEKLAQQIQADVDAILA